MCLRTSTGDISSPALKENQEHRPSHEDGWLSREDAQELLAEWLDTWNAHDLDRVMDLLHDKVRFENWTGAVVRGKRMLRRAWTAWFRDHGAFRFSCEDLFFDEDAQKVLLQWTLEWPSSSKSTEGCLERRRGVDVVHFQSGMIISKLAYSKTAVQVVDRA